MNEYGHKNKTEYIQLNTRQGFFNLGSFIIFPYYLQQKLYNLLPFSLPENTFRQLFITELIQAKQFIATRMYAENVPLGKSQCCVFFNQPA